MKYIIILGSILSLMMASSLSAAPLNANNITPTFNSIIRKMPNALGKSWARSRVQGYKEALKNTRFASSRKEHDAIAQEAQVLMRDLQAGKYTFTISNDEKRAAEAQVIAYQKAFTKAIRKELDILKNNDIRTTGDVHLVFNQNNESTTTLNIKSYRIVRGKNIGNMEMDMQVDFMTSFSDLGFTGPIQATADLNILMVNDHIYVTLRDYTLAIANGDNVQSKDMRAMLNLIRGKTYSYPIGEYINWVDTQLFYEIGISMINRTLTILENEALLTPFAKHGNDYILTLRKPTIQKITNLAPSYPGISSSDIDVFNIPMDLRMSGKKIWTPISYINPWNMVLDQDTLGLPFFMLSGKQDDVKMDMKISHNDISVLAHMQDKKIFDFYMNEQMARMNFDNSALEMTMKMEKTGMNSYKYIFDMKENMIDISAKIWGNTRYEFGNFTLVPPPIHQSMETLPSALIK